MTRAEETSTILWASDPGGVSSDVTPPFSHIRSGGTHGLFSIPGAPNTTLPSAALTSNQAGIWAPEAGPYIALPFSNEQFQPNTPIHTLGCVPYFPFDAPPTLQKSQFHAVAETLLESAASNSSASSSPSLVVSALQNDHETHFRHNLMWAGSAPPLDPAIIGTSSNHETRGLSAGAHTAGPNLSQPASVMESEMRHNRINNRHERLSFPHPYIPLVPSNYLGNTSSRDDAEYRTQLLPQMESARILRLTDPDWRLTLSTYEWLFAVMYPKRRPDKKKATPSGPCQLCDSTCKRPGILQQHLIILHRQRLARKHLAGQPYNLQLALAFVVAHIRSGVVLNAQMDAVHQESQSFLAALKNSPAGLEPLEPQAFPLLLSKLGELSMQETWVGVQCRNCGMWATRRIALEEHATVCAGIKRSGHSLVAGPTVNLKLTASGLAARPNRGAVDT